jgi:hypothetical protein
MFAFVAFVAVVAVGRFRVRVAVHPAIIQNRSRQLTDIPAAEPCRRSEKGKERFTVPVLDSQYRLQGMVSKPVTLPYT